MDDDRQSGLDNLASRIVSCRRCPRLVEYMCRVAKTKIRRYRDWRYWSRPIPGFGDPQAKLLIIGLAPAAHGGNRTGRMFTGDSSGEWLIRALYETDFTNQSFSVSSEDGLELKSTYITAVVRCAPPSNRPSKDEIDNCSNYLDEELKLLRKVKIVLTLGRTAFNTYIQHLPKKIRSSRLLFSHGVFYELDKKFPILAASYHPSRQNTQTKKLTWKMWIEVFRRIQQMVQKEY